MGCCSMTAPIREFLCLGFRAEAKENWREYVPDPSIPKSYKKQETIDRYIDDYINNAFAEAPYDSFAGAITEFSSVSPNLSCTICHDDPDIITPGEGAYRELSDFVFSREPGSIVTLFGLRIKERIRQCFMEGHTNINSAWGLYAAHGSYDCLLDNGTRVMLVDPVSLLFGGIKDYNERLVLLLRYMDYKLVSNDSRAEAQFVNEIVTRFNLDCMCQWDKSEQVEAVA